MPDPLPPLQSNLALPSGPLPPAEVTGDWRRFARDEPLPRDVGGLAAPPPPADPDDTHDPRVGYAIVLPAGQTLAAMSPTVREFAPFRGRCKIFNATAGGELIGVGDDQPVNADDPVGVGRGQLPRFVLFIANPRQISWQTQFSLHGSRAVGRLPIAGATLDRYLRCVIDRWSDPPPLPGSKALVWATDHADAITPLMRRAIAQPLARRYAEDPDVHLSDLADGGVSVDEFSNRLASDRPRMVVTTHHGLAPVVADQMPTHLGLPVDTANRTFATERIARDGLLSDGLWYSHSCCGAGSSSTTAYDDLLSGPGHAALRHQLQTMASFGDHVGAVPHAMLSSPTPAIGFIGQVELTFNWTLQNAVNQTETTHRLIESLYDDLFRGVTIGRSLTRIWERLGVLAGQYETTQERYATEGTDLLLKQLLHLRLSMRDVRSTVLIGDPAVRLVTAPARPPHHS